MAFLAVVGMVKVASACSMVIKKGLSSLYAVCAYVCAYVRAYVGVRVCKCTRPDMLPVQAGAEVIAHMPIRCIRYLEAHWMDSNKGMEYLSDISTNYITPWHDCYSIYCFGHIHTRRTPINTRTRTHKRTRARLRKFKRG